MAFYNGNLNNCIPYQFSQLGWKTSSEAVLKWLQQRLNHTKEQNPSQKSELSNSWNRNRPQMKPNRGHHCPLMKISLNIAPQSFQQWQISKAKSKTRAKESDKPHCHVHVEVAQSVTCTMKNILDFCPNRKINTLPYMAVSSGTTTYLKWEKMGAQNLMWDCSIITEGNIYTIKQLVYLPSPTRKEAGNEKT